MHVYWLSPNYGNYWDGEINKEEKIFFVVALLLKVLNAPEYDQLLERNVAYTSPPTKPRQQSMTLQKVHFPRIHLISIVFSFYLLV